jgi:hypothetical protein
MLKLEQLEPGAAVRGIVSDAMVVVVIGQWFGFGVLVSSSLGVYVGE